MTHGAPHPYEPSPRDRRHSARGPRDPARRRSRARALLPLGVAGWAVLEIWLLTLVAGAAGGLTVLLVLLAGLVLGSFLVRRAGRRAWQRLSATLDTAAGGQPPVSGDAGRRGGDILTMLGGLLLIVPGLVSDVAGVLCLFPPSAALFRRAVERRLPSGGFEDMVRQARGADQGFGVRRQGGRVVRGEVVREEEVRDDEPDGR